MPIQSWRNMSQSCLWCTLRGNMQSWSRVAGCLLTLMTQRLLQGGWTDRNLKLVWHSSGSEKHRKLSADLHSSLKDPDMEDQGQVDWINSQSRDSADFQGEQLPAGPCSCTYTHPSCCSLAATAYRPPRCSNSITRIYRVLIICRAQ